MSRSILAVLAAAGFGAAGCVAAPQRVMNPFDPASGAAQAKRFPLVLGVVQTPSTRNAADYAARFSRSGMADVRWAARAGAPLSELDAVLQSRFARVVPLPDPSAAAAAGVDVVLVVDAHASYPNLAIGTAKLDLTFQVRSPAGEILESKAIEGATSAYVPATEKVARLYDQVFPQVAAWLDGSPVLAGAAADKTAGPDAAPRAAVARVPAVPRSDIDELPRPASPRRAHAVVIGVERYRESLPAADFAAADARLASEYLKRLGVPEANVALLVDDRATRGDFEKYLERWLPNRVEAGDEVFVYFSGHGAPNPAKGDAYLVPYDGDPTYIEQTGYPLARLYAQLSKLPAKRVLVAMDSCFSGAGGRSVIAKGARPLVSLASAEPPAKVTVLSASSADQISNSYREKGHGLFTYFLLKGLKEKGADFRAAFDYLKPEVSRIARREYNADQDPQWREGK